MENSSNVVIWIIFNILLFWEDFVKFWSSVLMHAHVNMKILCKKSNTVVGDKQHGKKI